MAGEMKAERQEKNLTTFQQRKRWLTVSKKGEKTVEVGRIASVIWGAKHYRKLVTIVDLIDRNRVVVDGSGLSNIRRQSYPLRRLQMTKYRINITKDVPRSRLVERLNDTKVLHLYQSSAAGRRNLCQIRRENMNDFDRWKLNYTKTQFKKAVAKELLNLRSQSMIAKAQSDGKLSADEIQQRYSVAGLQEQGKKRLNTHPVLRRVAGSFKRKLNSKTMKKAEKRFNRERRYSKYVGGATRAKRAGAKASASA